MEGPNGIMVEMAPKPVAPISAGPEAQPIIPAVPLVENGESSSSEADSKTRLVTFHGGMEQPENTANRSSGETSEQGPQDKESTEPSEDSLTPEEQKQQEILDQIEAFREAKLDEKNIAEIEKYLRHLLGDDEEENQKPKFVDTLAALTRLFFLLVQLFMLLGQNKDKYTGEDLLLSNTPPEGEDNEVLSRIVYGESNKDSWKKFRDGVSDLKEPMDFGEFMSKVLALNDTFTGRSVKIDSESKEKKNGKNFKKLREALQAKSRAAKPVGRKG